MSDESFTAFGHQFSAEIRPWRQELISLETEGVTYEEWLLDDEDGGPGLYRVRFKPAQIHRYVRGLVGWEEFLLGGFDAVSDRPLAAEAARTARQRVDAQPDIHEIDSVCAADFLGEDVEGLICGWRLERAERIRTDASQTQASAVLHEIASSLGIALRALSRLRGKDRFAVTGEAEFQDLLYLVLRSVFSDTRREEWTPSAAGNAKRVDLAIPLVGLLIEAKYVRSRAHGKKVADELRVDIESYHSHPSYETLFALVWDEAKYLSDPQQLERDLSASRTKGNRSFEVTVRVIR